MKPKSQHQLRLIKQWNVTYTQAWALSYIGRHRRTLVKPNLKSCPVSIDAVKQLEKWHWLMWVDDAVILTAEGWRRWHLLHPSSKYR